MIKRQEPGVLSKLLSTGLGALFLTEEGIRKSLKPLGLPRDVTKYLVGQVDKRKDEMMQMVREELHQALSRVPFDRIARDILGTMDIEFTIHFVPKRRRKSKKLPHRLKSKR